jgi:YD repeat-containing protein
VRAPGSLTSTNAPHPNYTADTNTNRLIAPAGYTYTYDAAGNQTSDNYSGQDARTYDGENRLKQAWANNQWQSYTYDADGRRIKRNVNGVETWQLYAWMASCWLNISRVRCLFFRRPNMAIEAESCLPQFRVEIRSACLVSLLTFITVRSSEIPPLRNSKTKQTNWRRREP